MARHPETLIALDQPAGVRVPASVSPLRAVFECDPRLSGIALFESENTPNEKSEVVSLVFWFLTDRFDEENSSAFTIGSTTHFQRIKCNPYVALWEIETKVTRAEDILNSIAERGLTVLGDGARGGSPFHFLALHRLKVTVRRPDGKVESFSSPPPRLFERPGLTRDAELVRLLSGMDRRQRLFDLLARPRICLRLAHHESPHTDLDLLGEVLWCSHYHDQLTKRDCERLTLLGWMLGRSVHIRLMQNRGRDPLAREAVEIGEVPEKWIGEENGAHFLFKKNSGLSAGLFLDQRPNRRLLANSCGEKSVLNLFAYTGGFTVAALRGQARAVTHVDLSESYNQWARENVELNAFRADQVRWIQENCFRYVERLIKRGEKFDWIICDPPSFSRDKKTVFRIEKDFLTLIKSCLAILSPQGTLLFSTNYEGKTQGWFAEKIRESLRGTRLSVRTLEGGRDFEIDSDNPRLKSFLISESFASPRHAR